MKLGPLDDLPRELTPEAEQDKLAWIETIISLKGKERKDAISRFVDRYKQVPHIPDSLAS